MDLKDAKYLIPTLAVVAVGLQQKKQIANMSGLKLTLNIGRNKKSVLTPLSVSLLYGRVSTGIGANNAISAILAVYPELADPWIEDEERAKALGLGAKWRGRTYLTGITIRELRDQAQHNLFKDYHTELANINPAYNCACTP